MTVSIELDDKLVHDGLEFGGQPDEAAMISEAVREYVDRWARQRLINAFGTFDFYPDYDPKAGRR